MSKKTRETAGTMHAEMVAKMERPAGSEESGVRGQESGPDVCRMVCRACPRKMCSGAAVLKEIAGMPAYDSKIGLSADDVGSVYEEARGLAAKALAGVTACSGAAAAARRAPKMTQVYLRFVGVRLGLDFQSARMGPWSAHVADGVIAVDAADKVELDGEQKDLETHSHASGLTLQVALVEEGSTLGVWSPVTLAVANG